MRQLHHGSQVLKLCHKCGSYLPSDRFYVIRGKPCSPCKTCIRNRDSKSIKRKLYMKKYGENYIPPPDSKLGHPLYGTWHSMKQRCSNPSNDRFKDYGGRGIKVCERWKSFDSFLSDMGPRPVGTTLDRWPDINGNYEPGNCRWATPKEQQNNTRNNLRLTLNGVTHNLTEWAKELAVNPHTLRCRIYRGWPVELVLGNSVRPRRYKC